MKITGNQIIAIGAMIDAAESGRMCHFNGGQMYFVDESGRCQIADITTGKVYPYVASDCAEEKRVHEEEREAQYLKSSPPYFSEETGSSLRNHLAYLLARVEVSA